MSDCLVEVKKNISAVVRFLSRWVGQICVRLSGWRERITGVIKGREEYDDKIKTSPLLTEPVLANIRSPDAHK